MKKLTLTADPEVIDLAKKLADERGTSVSSMFSQLIRAMGSRHSAPVAPITRGLTGIARASRYKSDRRIIEDAILHKHAS